MKGAALVIALVALGVLDVRGAPAQNPNPMDSIRKLPGYRPAADTTHYLSPARIARYGGEQVGEWTAYIARSREQYTRDTLAMRRELRAAGLAAMVRGPYTHGFEVDAHMT